MNFERTSVNSFTGRITLGTQVGYSDDVISENELINFIQEYQDMLIQEKNLFLSVCLSECKIILSGQVEPHLQLNFINYPKFSLRAEILREEIEAFAKALMERFSQNRIVVEFPEETVMLEQSKEIDPRINTKGIN
ncbi:hypothetical protein JW887_03475 [Candidatus Dojkabacteria bacterium]|nr:hypothetical protein [Candidatus Dojkabacteria bacterium]